MPSYVRNRRTLDDAEIIRLYVCEQLDSDTIGAKAQCSGTTVLNIVRSAGHPVRKSGRGVPRSRLIDDAEIIRRYRDGASGPAIADAAGCSASGVYHVLRRHGVAIRPAPTGRGRFKAPADA